MENQTEVIEQSTTESKVLTPIEEFIQVLRPFWGKITNAEYFQLLNAAGDLATKQYNEACETMRAIYQKTI